MRETKWDGIWRKNTFIVQYYERVRNLSQWNRRWKLPNLQQSMRIHVTNICCIIWNEKGTTFGEPVQTFVIPILRCPNRRSPQPPLKSNNKLEKTKHQRWNNSSKKRAKCHMDRMKEIYIYILPMRMEQEQKMCRIHNSSSKCIACRLNKIGRML